MQKKLLAKNTMASLLAQVTVLVCGFILPRFFLQSFRSVYKELHADHETGAADNK